MNIKSLILGSATVALAATGAHAADAIVIAEPEPVEYVRVCDVYGAGFFYIPGTETCLKIGGYVRVQFNYSNLDWQPRLASSYVPTADTSAAVRTYRYNSMARFAPSFDVRSETELGTLRAFGEMEFDWYSYTWSGAIGMGSVQTTNLNHAFIELINANGTLRLGKGDTPYARFLGYGTQFGPLGTPSYGFNNSNELSYTFRGANGFSAIIAAIESTTGQFEPAIEGGVNFAQGWGSIGAIAGYDTVTEGWGGKIVARAKLGNASVGAHLFYADDTAGRYAIEGSEFSVLVHGKVPLSSTFAAGLGIQWFDNEHAASGGIPAGTDYVRVTGALDWNPVAGLRVQPEVSYTTESKVWQAALRFNRTF